MRASALDIDGKGIIAQNADNEESYVNLGNLILEASENFRINDDIKALFWKKTLRQMPHSGCRRLLQIT